MKENIKLKIANIKYQIESFGANALARSPGIHWCEFHLVFDI